MVIVTWPTIWNASVMILCLFVTPSSWIVSLTSLSWHQAFWLEGLEGLSGHSMGTSFDFTVWKRGCASHWMRVACIPSTCLPIDYKDTCLMNCFTDWLSIQCDSIVSYIWTLYTLNVQLYFIYSEILTNSEMASRCICNTYTSHELIQSQLNTVLLGVSCRFWDMTFESLPIECSPHDDDESTSSTRMQVWLDCSQENMMVEICTRHL